MRVGVPGSGLTGGKLGTILARGGHEVIFSYSRHLMACEGDKGPEVVYRIERYRTKEKS